MHIPKIKWRWRRRHLLPAVAVAALLSGSAVAVAATAGPAASGAVRPLLTTDTKAGCNHATQPGVAHCDAIIRTPSDHVITADAAGPPASALGPADIQSAYKLPSAGGGQTVAIVDAFGDSQAESDLAVFRSYYNLPPCTTANGCFKKVDQTGGTSYPADDAGWAGETSLDLDAVSSACPACNILLVQGNTPSVADLGAAENEAVALGAKYVSNSYGTAEFNGENDNDHYYDHPGVAVTVSSGDVGNVTEYPSASGVVTAVGGTRLTKDTSVARGWTESAWASGGSGCSPYYAKPDFQLGISTGCDKRAIADIAADADPASGLATYDTVGQGGWLQIGGTSLASPLIAAMYALGGPPAPGSYPNTYPYHDTAASSDLFDITSGSNGSCGNVLCQAEPGWDGPTGLGTPDGIGALAGVAHGQIAGTVTDASTGKPVSGATVTANPGNYQTRTGPDGRYSLNAEAGSYRLTASDYAYQDATKAGITVTDNSTSTADLAMTPGQHATVSGTVTDGSGHGWPLYAKITITGYPGGPVFTDPGTGKYHVTLPGPATYSATVVPAYPSIITSANDGYLESDITLTVGNSDSIQDISLKADQQSCTAPGYGWDGMTENFDGNGVPSGWKVSGTGQGWRFDDPGQRNPPAGGNDLFAVADAGIGGGGVSTTLTSPEADLSGQAAPSLSFDNSYYAAAHGQSADVQLSTDGGHQWTTVWHQDAQDAVGPVDLALPEAAAGPHTQVRFRFSGEHGNWWAIDNVLLGTHQCVPLHGGLVVGVVTDHATGGPLNGAAVAMPADPLYPGLATGTADPNLAGGFYRLFVPGSGDQTLTASATGYTSASATVTVTDNEVTRQDWALTGTGGTGGGN